MNLELRLTNHKEIDRALRANIDWVGIGDEGCVYRIPKGEELREIIEKAIERNIRPRIITPRVAQRELEIISSVVQTVSAYQEEVDVIVNDLGVLALCNEAADSMGIYFGRQLVRSIFDCPWHDSILGGEDAAVKRELSRHSYDHKEKMDILKRFKVRGIEINHIKGITGSLQRIAANGISLGIHLGNSLLTVGRDCITGRHLGVKPPKCIEQCGEVYEIEWDGLWLSPTSNDIPAGPEHKQCLDGAVVKGNRVLKKSSNTVEELREVSVGMVIIEEESDWDSVVSKISEIQEIINKERGACYE